MHHVPHFPLTGCQFAVTWQVHPLPHLIALGGSLVLCYDFLANLNVQQMLCKFMKYNEKEKPTFKWIHSTLATFIGSS